MSRFIFIILSFVSLNLYGQLSIVNNGTAIFISPGCQAIVKTGNLLNNAGTFVNQGYLEVEGDITNQSSMSSGSISSAKFYLKNHLINHGTLSLDSSNFYLYGSDQTISGTNPFSFYNLKLSGRGKKSSQVNFNIQNELDLKNAELAADYTTIGLLNPLPTSLKEDSLALISTDNKGLFFRTTNSISAYLFPMGSSRFGSRWYKPIVFSPRGNALDTLYVRFNPRNPTTDNYDITNVSDSLCIAHSEFYYQLDRRATHPIQLDVHYDPRFDGDWNRFAVWNSNWTEIDTVRTTGISFRHLNFKEFGLKPITYSKVRPRLDLVLSIDSIHVGGSATIEAVYTSSASTQLRWQPANIVSCQDCQKTAVSPDQSGFVIAQLTDNEGCFVSDSVYITVLYPDIFFPTAFSPNVDGRNDRYDYYTNAALLWGNFQIYNRWGEKVFHGDMLKHEQWDGTYKGEPTQGVFSIIAEYELIDKRKLRYTGGVTVMR